MGKKTQNSSTMGIKCRVANNLRAAFYKKEKESFSAEEKANMFDHIYDDVAKMHTELNNYKAKRKFKANVAKERELRGYVPTKKTSLAEWEKMQDANFKASVSEAIA